MSQLNENEITAGGESKSWFSDVSWKAALIYVALSVIGGGSAGVGLVASKAVAQAEPGLTQDKADVRYLTRDEAGRWRDVRDIQVKEIKEDMVTKTVFDERTRAILQQIELSRQDRREDREYLERLLLNR